MLKSLTNCVCFGYHKSLGHARDCETCSSSQWKTWIRNRGAVLLDQLCHRAVPLYWKMGKRHKAGLAFLSVEAFPSKEFRKLFLKGMLLFKHPSLVFRRSLLEPRGSSTLEFSGSCMLVLLWTQESISVSPACILPTFYSALSLFLGSGALDSSRH